MTKREIAKEIYRVEKPNMDETFFIKRMCNNYSKDVLLLILEEAKKERM